MQKAQSYKLDALSSLVSEMTSPNKAEIENLHKMRYTKTASHTPWADHVKLSVADCVYSRWLHARFLDRQRIDWRCLLIFSYLTGVSLPDHSMNSNSYKSARDSYNRTLNSYTGHGKTKA